MSSSDTSKLLTRKLQLEYVWGFVHKMRGYKNAFKKLSVHITSSPRTNHGFVESKSLGVRDTLHFDGDYNTKKG